MKPMRNVCSKVVGLYDDLNPAAGGDIRGNASFFAYPRQASGGGSLDVVPWTGESPFLIAAHAGGITDFEFAPHDERLLLSSSEDWTMKLWRLPDDTPRRRLVWHMEAKTAYFDMAVPELLTDLKWNCKGSLLAAASADKNLRIIDPYPHFDESFVLLAGRGDDFISFVQVSCATRQPLQKFVLSSPQRGFDLLPSRCIDPSTHEIARGVRLLGNGAELLSFRLPRTGNLIQQPVDSNALGKHVTSSARDWIVHGDTGEQDEEVNVCGIRIRKSTLRQWATPAQALLAHTSEDWRDFDLNKTAASVSPEHERARAEIAALAQQGPVEEALSDHITSACFPIRAQEADDQRRTNHSSRSLARLRRESESRVQAENSKWCAAGQVKKSMASRPVSLVPKRGSRGGTFGAAGDSARDVRV
ncbi:Coro6 [Symbiodinium sp. CCMP2592]|nr:Coro6 [Symbiodinium sp. CCMP2592]